MAVATKTRRWFDSGFCRLGGHDLAKVGVRTYRNRRRCPACAKESELARRYLLSKEEVRKLLKIKRCQICGRRRTRFVFDHCHRTKLLRGVICTNCNTLLGMAEDKVAVLLKAIAYLEAG